MIIMPVSVPQQIPEASPSKTANGVPDFANILNSAVSKISTTELKAEQVMENFLVGEVQDIHQVTIALQEAKLTMQLAVEVRNKVVEAYQEISRMQI
ncbi:flagellar hook-basal body complex protein FliE [Desulforamulus aquiferis]|uniref:Flagellar hook-basal body complex protein FliE n=1 Tax=Desulforamulus aquiferis TaxID=1397668 RepID=A0AAW7ZGB4_9FIRM|nr:flagellar hook-basal body complex protein FliE [Desulforamulus aquiferis]MDO7788364.1 flagellar hook-basal body complex protein FliE [Desulforamulus aquiferis]